jgi:hypothetical protein
MLVLALLFRVLCNERPSDISLYHLGCFKLQAPDHSSTHLASLALAALQPDAAHSADEMLEAFRAAGAVLLIKAPKCKQSERKRGRAVQHSCSALSGWLCASTCCHLSWRCGTLHGLLRCA